MRPIRRPALATLRCAQGRLFATLAVTLAVTFAVTLATPAAAQTTLDFDDVTTAPNAAIPDGYGGLQWDNFSVQDGTRPLVLLSGYGRGLVSPAFVAFNGGGTPAELSMGSRFDFNSAHLAAVFNEGLTVQVTGYRGSDALFSRILTLGPDAPTHVVFDFLAVDRVRFESSGGVDVGTPGTGTHFVMDDMVFTSPTVVPEPSTVLLLATGLAGLGAVARRVRGAGARTAGSRIAPAARRG